MVMKSVSFKSQWFTPEGLSQQIKLRYALFEPKGPARATIVFQGGRTEFIEKHEENIAELLERGFKVWSMDWRGQGLSSRPLADPHKGHIDTFSTYLEDFHHFLQDIVLPQTGRPDLIMGHSMGGHIITRYLHRYPASTQRAVLVAPMTKINSGGAPEALMYGIAQNACRLGLSRQYAVSQHGHDESNENFESNRLTTDLQRFRASLAPIHINPDLALGGITYGWLTAAVRSMRLARKKAYLRKVLTPILLVSAVDDRVVDPSDHVAIARKLHNCRLHRIYSAEHEVLHENDFVRQSFWRAFDSFCAPILQS